MKVLGLKGRRKYGEGYEYKRAGFYTVQFTGRVSQKFRRFFSAKVFELFGAFSYFLSHVQSKAYGALSLSFGLVSLFLYFIGASADASAATVIVSVALSILSVPFLFSDQPLPALLQNFGPTDFIFYDFLCIKRNNRMEGAVSFPIFVSIAIGILLAMLGYFIPVKLIISVIAIIVFVYFSFDSPEFPLILSFLLLPYFRYFDNSSTYLVIIVALAVVSFLRKVVSGKRVLNVEPYDVMLAVFTLMILISGIFVKGMDSFSSSVEMIVLAMGYTLAGNIITNRRLADCAINSIVISSVIPSVISISQLAWLLSEVGIFGIDYATIGDIFVRKNQLAALLLAAVVLSAGMAMHSKGTARAVYTVVTVLNFLALSLTGEYFAIFTLLLGALAFAVLKSRRLPILALPVLLVVPYVALIIVPNFVLDEFFRSIPSLGTADELFGLWQKCMTAFSDNFFVGIGIGKESFAEEMAGYGVFGPANSSNLFIEIGLEAGALALISFLVLLVIRMNHRTSYHHFVKFSQTAATSRISEACVFCLLIFGTMSYIWSDLSVYYLFWCIFGIGSAAIRVAKKDYDDREMYYEDTRAVDYSVIDVEIE